MIESRPREASGEAASIARASSPFWSASHRTTNVVVDDYNLTYFARAYLCGRASGPGNQSGVSGLPDLPQLVRRRLAA